MADKKADAKKSKAAKKDVKADIKAVKESTAKMMTDLRSLGDAELNKALIDASDDLKKAKKMLKANELPASHVIKQMKTKIAQIHTVMTEKKNEKEAK